ncbi:MAG: tolC [Gammaproteobacteria bacterium]|nr:tolC [Gammaproteobacteria bacterium]
MKKIMRLGIPLSLLSVSSLAFAQAADLMQVYQDAFIGNPTFLAAKANAQAQMQEVPIARAGLLPSAMATATDGFNNYNNQGTPNTNVISPAGNTFSLQGSEGTYRYNQQYYQLSASQPIFDVVAFLGYSSAKYTASAAASTFNAALQTLISTTAQAYFNELNAEDNLAYEQAEKQANYETYTEAQQKFEVGLIAITDVEQARAQYDSQVAAVIAAEAAVVNAKENLRAITGVYYDKLASLRNNTAPLISPQPADVNKWVQTADKQNWSLLAARQTAEAARKAAQQAQAGHLPILDGVTTYTGNNTGDSPSGKVNNRDAYVGLQLTVPIFENGVGYVSATAKQASYLYEADLQNRNNTYLSTMTNVRQSFNNTLAFISQVEADKQTIKASKLALDSIIAAYQVGGKTMLDVLNQQQDLYTAWSTYSTDLYSYINSSIALKQAAGTLSPLDLQQINTWLTENRQPFTPTMYSSGDTSIKRGPLAGGT